MEQLGRPGNRNLPRQRRRLGTKHRAGCFDLSTKVAHVRNAAPAMMKADAVAPDPFDRQCEPVADTLYNQSFYSTDFLSVLTEQARPSQRIRAVPPIRPHLSDDARHAPTLAAGAVACVLVAGIAIAFWIALAAGMAPLGGKSGLPRVEIAQTPLGIADPPAGTRAAGASSDGSSRTTCHERRGRAGPTAADTTAGRYPPPCRSASSRACSSSRRRSRPARRRSLPRRATT